MNSEIRTDLQPYFVVYDDQNNSCSAFDSNRTLTNGSFNSISVIQLSFSIIGFFLNLTCFAVFVKIEYKSKRSIKKKGSMNISLVFLSIMEMLFGLSSFLNTLMTTHVSHVLVMDKVYSEAPFKLKFMPVLINFLSWLVDVSVFSRNWITCFITVARAEVILFPLPKHCFLRDHLKFVYCVVSMFMIFVVICLIRKLDYYATICFMDNLKQFVYIPHQYLDLTKAVLFFFIFGTALPWVLILVLSCLIIVKIRNSNDVLDKRIAQKSIYALVENKQRRSNQSKASITVVLVAAIFTITQFPSLLISFLYTMSWMNENNIAEASSNFLLQANSLLNIFVFILTLPRFRNSFRISRAQKQDWKDDYFEKKLSISILRKNTTQKKISNSCAVQMHEI